MRWVFAGAARSLIHERDVAEAAAVTLLEDQHHGQRYVITGPRAITQREQVLAIGNAIGRPLRWHVVTREEVESSLGLPASALDTWESFIEHPEPVTDTFACLCGHPPRDFTGWALDHAGDFNS